MNWGEILKKSTNFWGVLRQNTLPIMCEPLIIFGRNFIKEERKKIEKEAKKEAAKNIQKLINKYSTLYKKEYNSNYRKCSQRRVEL